MQIIDAIRQTIKHDSPVKRVCIGTFWTAVMSRYCGLSSTLLEFGHCAGPPVREAGDLTRKTALELCEYISSNSQLERSIGLAAINSLLEIKTETCQIINAADLLVHHGRGKRVCVVGHFPFIPRLRQVAKELWVLEKRPRLNDLPASEAQTVLPQADVAAITSTALLNGTMAQLLALCRPDAIIMVLGPSTPLSPVWFEHGVSLVSGTRVIDPEVVFRLISEGITFSQFKGRGVKLLSLVRKEGV